MSFRKSLAWMLLSQVGLFGLQFANTVVLARLLTPYDMGIFAAANSIIGLLAVLQAFGVASFVIREPSLDQALLASAFTINAVIALLLFAATIALSAFGGALLHSAGVGRVMRVLALTPLIGILEFLPAAKLEREGNFKALATVNLIRSTVGTATTISLAVCGWSYISIAWGAIASSVTGAVAFMLIGRTHVSFRFGLLSSRRILNFGLQQLAIQGVNSVAARLSEFLMGRFLGLSALGLYGRASNLNNIIWSNVHFVIGRVVFVDFAEQARRGVNLRHAYLQTVEIMTALLWPCFAGLAVLSAPLIELVYGDQWLGAAPPLAALAVSAILLVSITMTWELFVVYQETGRQARFEFARSAAGTLLFFGGCLLSITGAAVARVGEALFSVYLYRPHVERMTSTRLDDYLPIYARSGLLTALACGPALVLMIAYGWAPRVPFAWVATSVLAGILAWLAGLKLLDHPLLLEVRRVATRFLPSPRALAE